MHTREKRVRRTLADYKAVSAATRVAFMLLIFVPISAPAANGDWTTVRPDGGYAGRFIAVDDLVYLLSGSRLYQSDNEGDTWTFIAELQSHISDLAANGTTLFAATSFNGIMRSTDGGETWESVGLKSESWLNAIPLTSIAISHDTQETIYAGTYEQGVYVSTDNGESWSKTPSPVPENQVAVIAVDPVQPSRVLVGTYGKGLYETEDGGQNWTSLTEFYDSDLDVTEIFFSPHDPDLIIIGDCCAGVIVSRDGGANWTAATNGLPTFSASLSSIAFDTTDTNIIYAAFGSLTETSPSPLYRSADKGQNWTHLGKPDPVVTGPSGAGLYARNDGKALMGSSRGVWLISYEDGTGTWSRANAGFKNGQIQRLAIAEDGSGRLVGVSRNTFPFITDNNGETWTELANDSLPNPDFVTVAINPADRNEIWLGQAFEEGLLKTSDGSTFQPQPMHHSYPYVSQVVIDPVNPGTVLAVEDSEGVVYRTTTSGSEWSRSSDELSESDISPWANALVMAPSNPEIVYLATTRGLYKSTNGGVSWLELIISGEGASVWGLAVDPADENIVYASTWFSGIHRSDDGGSTWMEILDSDTISPVARHIAVDPQDSSRLLVADDYHVYASSDGGASWSEFSDGLPVRYTGGRTIEQVVFDPTMNDRYYVSVDDFLYVYDGPLPLSSGPGEGNGDGGGNSGGNSGNSDDVSSGGGGPISPWMLAILLPAGLLTKHRKKQRFATQATRYV